MTSRPILPVLAALSALIAGGQFLGTVGTNAASASPDVSVAASAVVNDAPSETADGISIVADRDAGAVVDREAELDAERYKLSKERAQIAEDRKSLEAAWDSLGRTADNRHEHLAKIYAEMPAEKAAAIMVKLEPSEAAPFIVLMPGGAGAEILAAMPADAAVAISKEILTRTSSARRSQ